jgi:DNA-binding beta-propeller fold protein YncE
MRYGLGCAVVVDGRDRVIVTSRSASPCVAIFDKDGRLLETWTKDFADKIGLTPAQVRDTAHGLYWSKEGNDEFLYWTENVSAPKGAPRIGARVYKTDLTGRVLYTLGNVASESATSQKVDFANPTDVAVAPNGDVYVVDGYGSQRVFRFDRQFKLLKVIGGPGKEHGKFSTCHGVWVSTLRKDPEVYIADRANGRVEVFSPELEYKRTIPDFRAPCCFYQHDGRIYVPELNRRVTVIDADDKVVAHLGDGTGAANPAADPAKFAAPHALTVSSAGDLYVVEWVGDGRVRKLRRG